MILSHPDLVESTRQIFIDRTRILMTQFRQVRFDLFMGILLFCKEDHRYKNSRFELQCASKLNSCIQIREIYSVNWALLNLGCPFIGVDNKTECEKIVVHIHATNILSLLVIIETWIFIEIFTTVRNLNRRKKVIFH